MPEERRRLRNIICIILCIVLVAGLFYLHYVSSQEESAYFATLKEQQEEAAPYEEELQNMRSDLESMEAGYVYTAEKAGFLVGFLISGTSDLEYIENLEAEYDFTPVLVLDCVMEQEELRAIVDAAKDSWEIMLGATVFSDTVNENVLSLFSYLESVGREQSGVFFLRQTYYGEVTVALLEEDGFIGYTIYSDTTPTAGQTDDGTVYFEYSYLTATGTNIESRLSAVYSTQTFIITVIDMASINSGTLPDDYVRELLDLMCIYAEKEDCTFVTVAETVEELSHVKELEEAYYAEYEETIAGMEERIAELKEIIARIYEKVEY